MKKIKLLISSLTFAFLLLVIALLVLNKDVRKTLSALKFVGTVFAQTAPYWTIERDGTSNNLKFYYQTNSPVMQMSGDGKVGIGTVPESKLQVESGMLWLTGLTDNNGNLPGLGFYGGTSGGGIYARGSAGAGNFSILNASHTFLYGQGSNGNVGIGTTSPSEKLDVNGNITLGGSIPTPKLIFKGTNNGGHIWQQVVGGDQWVLQRDGVDRVSVNYNGTLNVKGGCDGCGASSDIRLKKDIKNLNSYSSLEKVLQLQGVTHAWRKDEFPGRNFDEKTHLGFVAQDLEKVIPEVVSQDPEGYKIISYQHLVPLLTEAMKEQQKEIELLKKEIQLLKNK